MILLQMATIKGCLVIKDSEEGDNLCLNLRRKFFFSKLFGTLDCTSGGVKVEEEEEKKRKKKKERENVLES